MNRNSLQILFVLIGTMVGAGFASGTEVFLFFSRYGNLGIIGALFSSLLTCLIVYKALKIIKYHDLKNYSAFVSVITNKKKSFINNVFSIIVNIFLYFSFIIMISGFGAFFYQTYGINSLITISIISLLCFYFFNNSVDNIAKINSLLIPFLIVIIFIYSSSRIYIDFSLLFSEDGNFFHVILSSILYSSYNSILLLPIVVSLNKLIKKITLKNINCISCLIFLILSILSISVINLLFSLDHNITSSVELPILLVIKNMGLLHYFIYGIIIIIAIFTSAVSTGYSLATTFKESRYYIFLSAILCFSAILFYKIDFSSLITRLYPSFGFLGIIQIFYLLLKKMPKTDIN